MRLPTFPDNLKGIINISRHVSYEMVRLGNISLCIFILVTTEQCVLRVQVIFIEYYLIRTYHSETYDRNLQNIGPGK